MNAHVVFPRSGRDAFFRMNAHVLYADPHIVERRRVHPGGASQHGGQGGLLIALGLDPAEGVCKAVELRR